MLVVDGGSVDATRRWSRRGPPLVDNPRRIQSAALNVALGEASGEIVVRVDGHCLIAPDYVERCVDVLERTGAAMVGGAMTPVADGCRKGGSRRPWRPGRRRPGPVPHRRRRGVGRHGVPRRLPHRVGPGRRWLRRGRGGQRGRRARPPDARPRRHPVRPVDPIDLSRRASRCGRWPASSTATAGPGRPPSAATALDGAAPDGRSGPGGGAGQPRRRPAAAAYCAVGSVRDCARSSAIPARPASLWPCPAMHMSWGIGLSVACSCRGARPLSR